MKDDKSGSGRLALFLLGAPILWAITEATIKRDVDKLVDTSLNKTFGTTPVPPKK